MPKIIVQTSLKFEIGSLVSFEATMKNVTSLIHSPNVTQKISSNPILQLDNPVTSKSVKNLNNTKNIRRKRFKSKIHCLPEMLSFIQRSSSDYQKIASRR